ncbi:MAG TPA: hypothetical protein VIF62_14320 [Labilithrix sp.]
MNTTEQRRPWQTAVLIALDEKTAKEAIRVLRALTLDPVEAAGVADALERIVAHQPALVVAAAVIEEKSGEILRERAIAVGAELVWLERGMHRIHIAERLATAASKATERRAAQGGA